MYLEKFVKVIAVCFNCVIDSYFGTRNPEQISQQRIINLYEHRIKNVDEHVEHTSDSVVLDLNEICGTGSSLTRVEFITFLAQLLVAVNGTGVNVYALPSPSGCALFQNS